MKSMRVSTTYDPASSVLWGVRGNCWEIISYDIRTTKPFDGDDLHLRINMTEEQFRAFNGHRAFALHRQTAKRSDVYYVEDVVAVFTGVEVVDSVFDSKERWSTMEIRLYKQHISFLVPTTLD